MFTEKEIENIKKVSSPKVKYLIYAVLFFSAVLSLVGSVNDYILSHKYAHLINKDMIDIFNGFIEGYSPSKTYDGAYCAAIERLVISITGFLTAILMLGLMLFVRAILKRNLKIINLIESKPR